jgi:hypothetical protein
MVGSDLEALQAARRALEQWVRRRDFAGWDPYDGLLSRLLPPGQPIGKYGRIAWTQFFKWCPVNLRQLFLIPQGHNPKGLGLFLQGYVDLWALNNPLAEAEQALELGARLEAMATRTPNGLGWGYNFPWQSRAFFLPQGTPTVVNTAFIAHALLDLAEQSGDAHWSDLALRAGQFVARDLRQSPCPIGICLSYTPLDSTCIHNANLLGAGLLIRLHGLGGPEEFSRVAMAALAFSLAAQQEDGSWHYADTSYQQWIDSYHTGFNLMALRRFEQAGLVDLVAQALARGESYYRDHLFTPNGAARYRHNQELPIDIHGPAAGILYFADRESTLSDAWRIFEWVETHMRNLDGSFAFLLGQPGWGLNRIPYMRWSQAWMWAALCRLSRMEGR